MNPIFKKLNFKGQSPVYIIQAPESFRKEIAEIATQTEIRESLEAESPDFFLAFVTKQSEVDRLGRSLGTLVKEDSVIWFAYPKGTSRKFKCEFNRDTGWQELGRQGFEGVRMVAIDEDWSALRFRKAEYIKKMTRGFAMSEEGKKKAAKGTKK